MKKRTLLWIALIVIVAIGGYFVWNAKSKKNAQDKEVVKIGAILPLTGNAAVYGQAMKNGIELAHSQSKIKDKIELIFEDDKGEQNSAVSATQLLMTKNVSAIIGGAQSKTASVTIPITDKNKIPLVAPGASAVDFDSISHYFFRLWPSDSYDGSIMADFIVREKGKKRIADFYTNSTYGVGISKVFERNVHHINGQIVFSEPFEEGTKDFRTQLLKIKRLNVDAIFIPGYIAEVSIILKQIEELNIQAEIFGTSSFYDEEFAKSLRNSKNNVYFSYPAFSIDDDNQATQSFFNDYLEKYKAKPDVFAANAYDCFKVIEKAINDGAKNALEIRDGISKIKDMQGVSGKFSFDEYGSVIKEFMIYQINDGDFIPQKKDKHGLE